MAITIHSLSTISQEHFKYMINIAYNLEKQGILWCTSLGSKLLLQKLIKDNTKDNPGFLMWISNYWFGCIFQHNNMKTKAKSVKYYILRFIPNGTLDIFEKMNDIDFLSVISGYCKKNNSRVKM